jgi:hypothetical protein
MSDGAVAKHDPAVLSYGHALRFILLLGVVSLLADMTYEGARSITGPYLAMLGASATAVGFVAGFGELIGYGVRLASGYLSDRTGRYWAVTIFGYCVNLLASPFSPWGVGMGAQESVMRAAIAQIAPPERRGTAYGIFNALYGAAWFAGSVLLGAVRLVGPGPRRRIGAAAGRLLAGPPVAGPLEPPARSCC